MKNTSFKTEYQEIMEFIRELQEAAFEQSDSILSEKKELEYKNYIWILIPLSLLIVFIIIIVRKNKKR